MKYVENGIINVKEISKKYDEETKKRVLRLMAEDIYPTFAVITVGDDEASAVYVKNKFKRAVKLGIKGVHYFASEENGTKEELISLMDSLNDNDHINGFMLQLPVRKELDYLKDYAFYEKDIDGFNYLNSGSFLKPCTPSGILEILDSIEYDLSGKHAVVIGRSDIVGKPIAKFLLERDATVTVCHSKTQNIKEITKTADLIVSAVGKSKMINSEWIKDGAVIIDVGMNRDENNKLCGDVDFDDVLPHVSAITPVPGGVGVMTVSALMRNIVIAAENNGKRDENYLCLESSFAAAKYYDEDDINRYEFVPKDYNTPNLKGSCAIKNSINYASNLSTINDSIVFKPKTKEEIAKSINDAINFNFISNLKR